MTTFCVIVRAGGALQVYALPSMACVFEDAEAVLGHQVRPAAASLLHLIAAARLWLNIPHQSALAPAKNKFARNPSLSCAPPHLYHLLTAFCA
jgi:hypothetical protein